MNWIYMIFGRHKTRRISSNIMVVDQGHNHKQSRLRIHFRRPSRPSRPGTSELKTDRKCPFMLV